MTNESNMSVDNFLHEQLTLLLLEANFELSKAGNFIFIKKTMSPCYEKISKFQIIDGQVKQLKFTNNKEGKELKKKIALLLLEVGEWSDSKIASFVEMSQPTIFNWKKQIEHHMT